MAAPPTYCALLSEVAAAFRARVPTGTLLKDSLQYADAFTGKAAVDALAQVLQTTDRNLALLVGRALDAQDFFHDVAYAHRLRDTPNEIYVFDNLAPLPLLPGGQQQRRPQPEGSYPNGVFTLLTDCYSSTCSRDKLCYSISCPRRLEQQTRNSAMTKAATRASEVDVDRKRQKLWSTSVAPEIVAMVSDEEKKRQEAIFEVIQKEKEYVDDLDLVHKLYIQPLRLSNIIEETRCERFIRDVFLNIGQLYQINLRLSRRLNMRRKENPVVAQIGDVFLGVVHEFYPYVEYGARQIYAKHFLAMEKLNNPEFEHFLEERERMAECRKLPLESFLARPTTHMGRYPLLLEAVLKRTDPSNPDRANIPQAIAVIKDVLGRINAEAGRADNLLKLNQLNQHLVFAEGEWQDLRLTDEGRTILRQGTLIARKTTTDSEVVCFLFDHLFLMAKEKKANFFKVHKRPIPLELLVLSSAAADSAKLNGTADRGGSTGSRGVAAVTSPKNAQPSKLLPVATEPTKYPLTLTHLGRYGGTFTLYANSQADRRSWQDAIAEQKRVTAERKRRFETVVLANNPVPGGSRINCSCALGSRIFLGCDAGVFVSDPLGSHYTQVLDLERIVQIDVLRQYGLLILLADRTLYTFPLEAMDPTEADFSAAMRKGRRVSSHVSFFKVGTCNDRTLICAVKSTSLSSTVKAFEPVAPGGPSAKKTSLLRLLKGSPDSVRVFKEFYIPSESTSIHFLKTKLCVGCAKGFEIVDLESLNTQGLLDPKDESLEFVMKRENLRPIAIYRLPDGCFLLCYDEFGFYVDKFGRRTRHEQLIQWTGSPSSFSLVYPYVIAFDSSLIEIRNAETGDLQQVIATTNLRNVSTDPELLHCVMDSPAGETQQLVKLKPCYSGPEQAPGGLDGGDFVMGQAAGRQALAVNGTVE
ncbi:CNH domain-containing protein [Hyaloraphidium curvatum]|nr:CNH domain-containing protein [Hyaloraphidium curvatum]